MERILPYFICVLFNGLFSLHYIVAKEILGNDISIYSLSGWRGLVGGGLILLIFRKQIEWNMLKKHKFSFIFLGIMGFFLNQILFMQGLKMSTPLNAALISNTIPVVSFVYSVIFKVENLNFKKFTGILLSFILVTYLIISNGAGDIHLMNRGNLLIFLNVFFFCGALVKAKSLLNAGIPFQIITGIMLFVGGFFMSLLAGPEFMDMYQYGSQSAIGLGYVFFEVIISTSVVYLLNLWSLKKLPVSTVTFFNYLQPLGASILSIIYYGHRPTIDLLFVYLGIIVGGFLVIKVKAN